MNNNLRGAQSSMIQSPRLLSGESFTEVCDAPWHRGTKIGRWKGMSKSVCSERDLDWGILGDWVLGSRKDSMTKDSRCSRNKKSK